MWLDEFANHLRTLDVPNLPQDAAFAGNLPHEVKVGVMLAGPYTGMPIDPELPGYHKGRMQIVARAKDAYKAEKLAFDCSQALAMEGGQVGLYTINYVRPTHLPVGFPSSNGDFYEASVNFDVCFVREIG